MLSDRQLTANAEEVALTRANVTHATVAGEKLLEALCQREGTDPFLRVVV